MNKKKCFVIRDSMELAILFLPLLSILPLILDFFSSSDVIFILAHCTGTLCFLANLSNSMKTSFIKWVLSLLFTIAFDLFLSMSHFDVRLVNTMYFGYGKMSAGGGFAILMYLIVFSVSNGIGCLFAVGCSDVFGSKAQTLLNVIQNILLPMICGVILLVVIYLSLTMPSWESIYRMVYN